MFCSLKAKIASLVCSGLGLAIFGIATYLSFPKILEYEILKRVVIREGSETYGMWKDVPVPIYLEFYFFTVSNPEEFYNLEKPILKEMGPYTFREERKKVNITFNANGTVSYRQVKTWHFQPDKTVGSLQDHVISLNVPMVAAASKIHQMDEDFMYVAITEMFDSYKCTWLVNKTVEELLFQGYEDPLMKFAQELYNLPYDKFGWFYARNNTDDGEMVIYTGEEDITAIDTVDTWNDEKVVSSYDPPCNMINGSAGDMWPPGLTRGDKPTIFVSDICRSLSFTYLKDVQLDGIKAYRYWADNTVLDNGKYNPDNKCFCSDGNCLPAGGVNVSTCKFDAPAVISFPHFLFADPTYADRVVGMSPDPKKHRMYIDLIPEMGVPLGVAARMQVNVVFEGIPKILQFANLTERTYFPMLWFSETAVAGTDLTGQLKLPLVTLPMVADIIAFVLIAIGSFLVLTAFVLEILYALGKIEDKQESMSNIPFVADTNEKPSIQTKDHSYTAVSVQN